MGPRRIRAAGSAIAATSGCSGRRPELSSDHWSKLFPHPFQITGEEMCGFKVVDFQAE